MDKRSKKLRKMILEMLSAGRRGHLGSALSIVEILRVLYDDILHFRAKDPKWKRRDRFILSKGHGCLALYAILADKGFFPKRELKKFCGEKALLGGHPEHDIPGVEVSTGSLGHGLSIGVGMAVALRAKLKAQPFEFAQGKSSKLKAQKVFVLIGDGEANEGSVWEAALSASKYKLDNLTVIVDYNKNQSYSTTSQVCELEPFTQKWEAFGFATREIDGHNIEELRSVLSCFPIEAGKPNAVICHTVKGKGIKYVEGNLAWHHKRGLTDEEIRSLYESLEEY